MDHQVVGAVRRVVHLDEVVAAAQGAQTPLQPLAVFQVPVAPKRRQVEVLLPTVPHPFSGGDEVSDLVQLGQVKLHMAQLHGVHAAADVHAHQVGDRLVRDGHGGADGAALTRMDVRHDPNAAPGGEFAVAQLPDLLHSIVSDHLRVANGGIELSFDLHYVHVLTSFHHQKSRLPQKGKRRMDHIFSGKSRRCCP